MRAGLILAVVVLIASPVSAQEESIYLTGGLGVSHVQGAVGDFSIASPISAGGSTAGWSFGAGAFLDRHVSLDVEFSTTGMMSSRQISRYYTTIEQQRQRALMTGLRFHLQAGALHFEPVGGVAVVTVEEPVTVVSVQPFAPSHFSSITSREAPGRFGLVGGLDVAIGGPGFAVVPSLRIVNSPFGLEFDTYDRWRWSLRTGVLLKVRLKKIAVSETE